MACAGVASGDLPSGIAPQRAASRLLGPIFFAATVIDVQVGDDDIESIVDDWLAAVRS